ncbi:uncharacterized protein CEXT_427201 [Caerostris extrusa]|uniref:Uncharacterized protein n=1 Tax=Caerostris extrusa TaxID=172846 RepID=A0AAV4RAK0_CAEEX|nr:uncharacterized protein CEXT_427201 [Caerostris extrusa]
MVGQEGLVALVGHFRNWRNLINGSNLTITSDGGTGGSGEDGGDGYSGRSGSSIDVSSLKDVQCRGDYSEIMSFKCQKLFYNYRSGYCVGIGATRECFAPLELCKYKIFGKPGEKAGDGGNGGRGGKSGNPGIITIFELNNNSGMTKHASQGKIGENGRAGKGGISGSNGDDLVVSYDSRSSWWKNKWVQNERISNEKGLSGNNGISGANITGLENPKPPQDIREPASILNEYKSYLRENLIDRFKRTHLVQFLDKLDSDSNVKSLYNTLGLVKELQGLEKQFHKLNKHVDFIPFYQSLLTRISDYAQNPKDFEKSIEYKKVLSYLYTATLGRIYSIKEDTEFSLVVDISRYLEIVKGDIETLKEQKKAKKKAEIINKHQEEYRKSVQKKIEEAKSLIDSQITPEIDNISIKIDSKIDLLINETIELKEKAEEEKVALEKKRLELIKTLELRGLFSGFKIFGQILSFLGPVGTAVGTLIGTTTSITESLALDSQRKVCRYLQA